MLIPEIDRRTFLKRMGQAGGLVVAGGSLEAILAACGGNVGSGATTPTPGVTPIGNAGLKTPGFLQWGADVPRPRRVRRRQGTLRPHRDALSRSSTARGDWT